MGYAAISGGPIPFNRNAAGASASGYYLKGYQAGTGTALSMGVDATPTTTIERCKLSSEGIPLSNDNDENTEFVPHFNQGYRLVLYSTEADADNDAFGNALWDIDNLTTLFDASQLVFSSGASVQQKISNLDVVDYAALTAIPTTQLASNDLCHVAYRTVAFDGGGGPFRWDSGDNTSNVTSDPGQGIFVPPNSDATGASGCWIRSSGGWALGAYHASWWGILSDNTNQFTPDGTDNYTQLQRFFNYMKGKLASWELPCSSDGKNIYTSQPLTVQVDADVDDFFSPNIRGNHNVITMRGSGYTGSTSVISIGSTSASAPGGQKMKWQDLEVYGPLLGDASWLPKDYTSTTAPAHTGAGIEIENWINIGLDNVSVQGCYYGFLNEKVWPITEINCRAENCYVGWFLKGDVTSRSSLRCRAVDCRWAVCMQPDRTAQKQVYGQVFDGFHFENCIMGLAADFGTYSGSGSSVGIRDIIFVNTYIEGPGYNPGIGQQSDVFRFGPDFNILDVTATPSNRTSTGYNFTWHVGQESYPTDPSLGGIQARINGTSLSVKRVYMHNTKLDPSHVVNWVGGIMEYNR